MWSSQLADSLRQADSPLLFAGYYFVDAASLGQHSWKRLQCLPAVAGGNVPYKAQGIDSVDKSSEHGHVLISQCWLKGQLKSSFLTAICLDFKARNT